MGGAVGVAVDEDTGYVYVTTGNQGVGGTDTIIVFDRIRENTRTLRKASWARITDTSLNEVLWVAAHQKISME